MFFVVKENSLMQLTELVINWGYANHDSLTPKIAEINSFK
jgi:hypothetical protein